MRFLLPGLILAALLGTLALALIPDKPQPKPSPIKTVATVDKSYIWVEPIGIIAPPAGDTRFCDPDYLASDLDPYNCPAIEPRVCGSAIYPEDAQRCTQVI